jgi:DNA-directed RNA polymerase alpha subunit
VGISNILAKRLGGKAEHKGKMFFLVTMTEAESLRLYMMGKIKLKLIKQWLATLGLTLGMSFPSDIHGEFISSD